MKPYFKVSSDFTDNFNKIVKRFKNDDILVGIPAGDTGRDDGGITNATLLALCNFGSPINNIPAWPVMSIGIANSKDQIAEQFKRAVTGSLKTGLSAISTYYERAGIIASNSIKKVINEQEDVPSDRPLESTLRARKYRGFSGTKYWVVTGQMRNAITYVVREAK